MTPDQSANAAAWRRLVARLLPFADSATRELPLGRILRLSLFQISAGMVAVLLTGTLNRVMIVELGVPGFLVSLMVALPLVFAPLRALIGYRSDNHRSVLGWRRGPYIWFGAMVQFGGLAIMPFALLILSGDTHGPVIVGHIAAAIAFLMVGAGLHTAQTAGLALATDLAPTDARPRVVALLYVMLLVGMLLSGIVLGGLLADFSAVRLIQVIQGAAVVSLLLNMAAMWKQEARNPALTSAANVQPAFSQQWRQFMAGGRASRLLVAVGLGAAGFGMQDVLLEPYGAQVLNLGVGQTTALTALWAFGTLGGFTLAARRLTQDAEPHRLAGYGAVAGAAAFATVIFAGAIQSAPLFCLGVAGIGFGGGLFSVGTMTAAMALAQEGRSGLALGAWGAVHATATGVAIVTAGLLRDFLAALTASGALGAAFTGLYPAYSFVYHIEIALLFAMLVAIGPLARHAPADDRRATARFGLADFPT